MRTIGFPDDLRIYDLFGPNFTLMEANSYDYIYDSGLYFETNLNPIFNKYNFKSCSEKNKNYLYSTLLEPPFVDPIDLIYGEYDTTILQRFINITSKLNDIARYVPHHHSNVTIWAYKTMGSKFEYFDFDKDDLIIPNLEIYGFGSSYPLPAYAKFSNTVKEIYISDVTLITLSSNFTIQKATLTYGASFSNSSHYKCVQSLFLDDKSLFVSGIEEYENEIEVSISNKNDNKKFRITYTSNGVDFYESIDKQTCSLDVQKIPKLTLVLNDVCTFDVTEGITEIKPVDTIKLLESDYIVFERNWENITGKIANNLIVENSPKFYILAKSMNFECLGIFNGCTIVVDKIFWPYYFSKKTIINSIINIRVYHVKYGEAEIYSVAFSELEMIGNSTITVTRHSSVQGGNIKIYNLIAKNGISKIGNIEVERFILEPGSIVNILNDFYFKYVVVDIYWDLNQMPIFKSSTFQDTDEPTINIRYNGTSIRKRKLLFDNFLSNGTLIMLNFSSKILANIHFISENTTEFNDGDDLALECKLVNDNEIYLYTTRQLYNESEVFETDSPSQSPSESNYPSPTASETPLPSSTPQQSENPTEVITPVPVDKVTQNPSVIEPTIEKHYSKNTTIVFDSDGYYDGDNFVRVKNNGNKISLINSNQQNLLLKSNSSLQSKNALYVSMENNGAVITISSPINDNGEYGQGKFGVHANSNNPVINLPQQKVPLSLFSNENSEVKLFVDQLNSNEIFLDKLTVMNGDIKINLQSNIGIVEFEEIEVFSSGKIQSYYHHDQYQSETKIGSLKMNPNSRVTFTKSNFKKSIKADSNTVINIEQNAKFNDETTIELADTSSIELGRSIIEGICKEIKIVKMESSKLLESESTAKLICGVHFDCLAWSEKYKPNDIYKYQKCIDIANEKCLVVSSMKESTQNPNGEKKKSSKGIIIAIVVVVIVVIIAIIVGVVICKNKKSRKQKSEDENNDKEATITL